MFTFEAIDDEEYSTLTYEPSEEEEIVEESSQEQPIEPPPKPKLQRDSQGRLVMPSTVEAMKQELPLDSYTFNSSKVEGDLKDTFVEHANTGKLGSDQYIDDMNRVLQHGYIGIMDSNSELLDTAKDKVKDRNTKVKESLLNDLQFYIEDKNPSILERDIADDIAYNVNPIFGTEVKNDLTIRGVATDDTTYIAGDEFQVPVAMHEGGHKLYKTDEITQRALDSLSDLDDGAIAKEAVDYLKKEENIDLDTEKGKYIRNNAILNFVLSNQELFNNPEQGISINEIFDEEGVRYIKNKRFRAAGKIPDSKLKTLLTKGFKPTTRITSDYDPDKFIQDLPNKGVYDKAHNKAVSYTVDFLDWLLGSVK